MALLDAFISLVDAAFPIFQADDVDGFYRPDYPLFPQIPKLPDRTILYGSDDKDNG